MAPNKFEKHIKKQLKAREIRPSANAWEKLAEKLDDSPVPSKGRNIFWYGIAASLIGLLVVSVLFFTSENPNANTGIEVVNVEPEQNLKTETISSEEIVNTSDEVVAERSPERSLSREDVAREPKGQTHVPKSKDVLIQEVETTATTSVEKKLRPEDLKQEIITTKVMEIVAAVDSLEQNNTALTNAEVDKLLRDAQAEILRDKLFDQNGSVDAMALLSEVEIELDQSFRDEIFDSLKSGFLKLRTAVADRNK